MPRRHGARRAFIAPRLLGSIAALAALPIYIAMRGVPGVLEVLVFAWLVLPMLTAYYLSAQGPHLLRPRRNPQMNITIYRYDPDKDDKPYMKDYDVQLQHGDNMLLDALVRVKEMDDSFAFRRSCREGVSGSDAMSINGRNGLACITKIADLPEHVTTHRVPLSLTFFHPSGLSASLTTTYYDQDGKFVRLDGSVEKGDDTFWLVDAAVRYRFPKRYGFLTVGVANLTDPHFNYYDTEYNNPHIQPDRTFYATITFALP